MWLAIGLALLALLVLLGPVLTPFIAAAILAYALNPGVDWLDSRRIGKFSLPRAVAVLLVILLLFAALLALILIVIPVLQTELPLLREKTPNYLAQLHNVQSPHLKALCSQVRLDGTGL